jgi:hypothetical protein
MLSSLTLRSQEWGRWAGCDIPAPDRVCPFGGAYLPPLSIGDDLTVWF